MKSKNLDLLKGLGVAVAAASVAPVLATAVSCATNNETRFDAIGGEFDREYNLSQSTYKALKSKFVSKVRAQLPPLVDRDMEILRLERSLESIDQKYASNTKYSYTLLSMMLVEKARTQYGVKLITDSTAQLSDITEMYNGIRQSFDAYMDSIPSFDREVKAKILNASQDKFHTLLYGDKAQNVVGILEKYDDPLTALIQAKAKIITCFDEINNDISLVASANRLSQFLSDYTIMVKDGDDVVHLDNLEKEEWFKKDADLSNHINDIFKIINNSTGDIVAWNPESLFPGYKITPTLTNISKDPYKNTYSLEIDWSCVKSTYAINPEGIDPEMATAHLFKQPTMDAAYLFFPKTEQEAKDFELSLHDLTKETNPISYHITLTPEGEVEALRNTYFDRLEFSWDTSTSTESNAYEAFFQGKKKAVSNDGKSNYRIASMALAASGLRVAVKSPTTNETSDPIRLDTIMSTTGIVGLSNVVEATKEDQNVMFIKQFLDNCELQSDVEIDETSPDIANRVVSNKIMSHYKNTNGINDDTTASIDNPIETKGFTLSQNSYAYLIKVYNNLSKMLEPYENDFYENQLKSIDDELASTTIWFSFGTIMNALCITFMFLRPWKGWTYWTIMALTFLSEAGQIADYWVLCKKHKKAHDFVNKLNKFRNSEPVVNFRNMLNNDQQDFSLIKAEKDQKSGLLIIDHNQFDTNYNIYKQKDWEGENGVKTIIERYSTIEKNPIYLDFVEAAKVAEVSPDDFRNKMDGYLPNGGYWWVSLALNLFSFTCDMASLCIVTPPIPKKVPHNDPEVMAAEGMVGVDAGKNANKVKDLTQPTPAGHIDDLVQDTQLKVDTFAMKNEDDIMREYHEVQQKGVEHFPGFAYNVSETSRLQTDTINEDMMYYTVCNRAVFEDSGVKMPAKWEWNTIQDNSPHFYDRKTLFNEAFSESRIGRFRADSAYGGELEDCGNLAELIIDNADATAEFAKNIERPGSVSNTVFADSVLVQGYSMKQYDLERALRELKAEYIPDYDTVETVNKLTRTLNADIDILIEQKKPGDLIRRLRTEWNNLDNVLNDPTKVLSQASRRIVIDRMEMITTSLTEVMHNAMKQKAHNIYINYITLTNHY